MTQYRIFITISREEKRRDIYMCTPVGWMSYYLSLPVRVEYPHSTYNVHRPSNTIGFMGIIYFLIQYIYRTIAYNFSVLRKYIIKMSRKVIGLPSRSLTTTY